MRIAYLECFSGISGDMLLGALADAGAPREELASIPHRLGLEGVSIEFTPTTRSHIAATHAIVRDPDASAPAHSHEEDAHAHSHSHDHEHEHHHSHAHQHEHREAQEHSHAHAHRSLADIERLIARSGLSPRTRETATAVFRRLGESEARIHAVPIEKVHFHEVGAVDSIVDIVGACAGFELLGIVKVYCSPLNVGSGTVSTEHGVLPVPAPATLDLLKSVGAPVYSAGPAVELVTPTGAAVVATLAAGFGSMPAMRVVAGGYGAGTRDIAGRPNVLRITLGEAAERSEPAASPDTVAVIEANIDDMTPQVAGYLTERALAAGALDIYFTPVYMKKNRGGMLVSVIAEPSDRERLARLLFEESTTIGVRISTAERRTLDRVHVPVETSFGPVRIKVSMLQGRVVNFAPEYDDCQAIASARGVPLKTVIAEASSRYLQAHGRDTATVEGTSGRNL